MVLGKINIVQNQNQFSEAFITLKPRINNTQLFRFFLINEVNVNSSNILKLMRFFLYSQSTL